MNILPYPGILCYTNFMLQGSKRSNSYHLLGQKVKRFPQLFKKEVCIVWNGLLI